jgi:uncharacterized repeat protein (TIGR01451 family)
MKRYYIIIGVLSLPLLLVLVLTRVSAHATPYVTGEELSQDRYPSALQASDVITVCPASVGVCPYTDIQVAVDAASDGDVIKVATGIYTGVRGCPVPSGYLLPPPSGLVTQVIYIGKTITIRGGYTTTNGFADPPDPAANSTTLDAQGQGRVLFIAGDISPTVEGLRITGGNAVGLGGQSWNANVGGGIYIITATATISDNQIFGNTASSGAGLFLSSSAAALNNNIISANTGTNGGGLYLDYSAATLSNNTVSANRAATGGGLSLSYSAAMLDRNTVTSNTNVMLAGGGLYLYESDAILSNNIIAANSALGGGGIDLHYSNATLSGNAITSNTARYGGGLHLYESDATLDGNIVSGNVASSTNKSDKGGGLFLEDSAATLTDNTISANTARRGGGLYLDYSDATLNDNVVSSNVAEEGGGLYLYGSAATISANIVSSNVASSTVFNDGGGGLLLSSSAAVLTGNTIISNTATWFAGGVFLRDSPATLSDNTIAINTAYWDGGGLTLLSSSAMLTGNTITSNIGRYGGGLYLYSSDAMLNRNTVSANTATDYCGGGLFLEASNATLVNNVVADNTGDGLHIWSYSPRLLHTTIAGNSGPGIDNASSVPVALTNTILTSHTVGVYVSSGSTVLLESTLWYSNTLDWDGEGTIIHKNDYTGNPDFVAPDAGDYHIRLTSAAIDKGIPTDVADDLDGEPRPQGGGYDIGADETGLVVTKQAEPDPVEPGAQLTYTIRVTNTGNATLHATITDTLPISVTIDATSGNTVILPGGSQEITWTAVITAPHGAWTEMVVVTVGEDCERPLVNAVEVTTEEGVAGNASVAVNLYKVYMPLILRSHASLVCSPTQSGTIKNDRDLGEGVLP